MPRLRSACDPRQGELFVDRGEQTRQRRLVLRLDPEQVAADRKLVREGDDLAHEELGAADLGLVDHRRPLGAADPQVKPVALGRALVGWVALPALPALMTVGIATAPAGVPKEGSARELAV